MFEIFNLYESLFQSEALFHFYSESSRNTELLHIRWTVEVLKGTKLKYNTKNLTYDKQL